MILSYEEFRDEFTKCVFESAKAFSAVTAVEQRLLYKSNRGLMEALSLKMKELNVAPVIYPFDAYEHYRSDEKTVSNLAREMVENAVSATLSGVSFDISDICPETAPDHLYLQILNGERNKSLAESTAHLTFYDLIAVPRWRIDEGSILCSHDFQREFLGFSDEEILNIALENTLKCDFSIRGLTEYLCDLSEVDMPRFEERMFLVLGDGFVSGAMAVFSRKMLEKICIAVEDEAFFIIPSSVSEIIAVPEWAVYEPGDLQKICREVNRTVVDSDDFLSDNIYRYESSTGLLTLLS
ncbi:MAG: DUF5688 family protein [Lachnospiraceae bacterium]|nr:DUF5688 family protein [Lachnospiraceae bacterium]